MSEHLHCIGAGAEVCCIFSESSEVLVGEGMPMGLFGRDVGTQDFWCVRERARARVRAYDFIRLHAMSSLRGLYNLPAYHSHFFPCLLRDFNSAHICAVTFDHSKLFAIA